MSDPYTYESAKKDGVRWEIVIPLLVFFYPVGIFFLFNEFKKRKPMSGYGKLLKVFSVILFVFSILLFCFSILRYLRFNLKWDYKLEIITSPSILMIGCIIGAVFLWKNAKKWMERAKDYPLTMTKQEFVYAHLFELQQNGTQVPTDIPTVTDENKQTQQENQQPVQSTFETTLQEKLMREVNWGKVVVGFIFFWPIGLYFLFKEYEEKRPISEYAKMSRVVGFIFSLSTLPFVLICLILLLVGSASTGIMIWGLMCAIPFAVGIFSLNGARKAFRISKLFPHNMTMAEYEKEKKACIICKTYIPSISEYCGECGAKQNEDDESDCG